MKSDFQHIRRLLPVGALLMFIILSLLYVSRFGVRAEKIAEIRPGFSEYLGEDQRHFWLDNQHILEFSSVENNEVDAEICRIGGTCARLLPLSAELSSNAGPDTVSSLACSAANGKLLAQNEFNEWLMFDINTGNLRKLINPASGNNPSIAVWADNGSHAVVLCDGGLTNVNSYDSHGKETMSCSGDFMATYYEYIGILSNGWVMGVTDRVGDGSVTAVQADTSPTPAFRHIFFIPTPGDAYGPVDAQLSHDGTQIAWMLDETPPPLGISAFNQTQLMRRIPPTLMSIWITDTNVAHWRRVYCEPITKHAATDLKWSPDDHYVSYIHQNAIWRVPVK